MRQATSWVGAVLELPGRVVAIQDTELTVVTFVPGLVLRGLCCVVDRAEYGMSPYLATDGVGVW